MRRVGGGEVMFSWCAGEKVLRWVRCSNAGGGGFMTWVGTAGRKMM